jgi:hypothetical protein
MQMDSRYQDINMDDDFSPMFEQDEYLSMVGHHGTKYTSGLTVAVDMSTICSMWQSSDKTSRAIKDINFATGMRCADVIATLLSNRLVNRMKGEEMLRECGCKIMLPIAYIPFAA